ncbi:MAG TPA: DUF4199 domain-containing protein [Puia sp.]|jgi:hypothetical protein|nr:DUF4199 domain-containing protein [Puia sp.]
MKKRSTDFMSKAILLSLVLIIINLIGGFAHLQFETWFRWLPSIILVVAIIIFCIQYGKQETEGVTYGKAFGYGFKISLVVSILVAIYALLSVLFIFPEFTDQALQQARAAMEAKGNLTEDQIDQGIAMTKKFMQPIPVGIFAFLGTLFFGTIASLLGAAFTKKSEPEPAIFKDNP